MGHSLYSKVARQHYSIGVERQKRFMKFDDSSSVEMITYQLKESDWVRGQNRARINDLFNGSPPYSGKEVQENDIKINVNDLASARAGHAARSQFYNAFLRQDRFFSARTDTGSKHKRQEYNQIVTSSVAKVMKRSLPYFEKMRSTIASNVLHGIGPGAWEDRDKWCNDPMGIEDMLIPADTLLTMKNLPFYAIYRSVTAPELIKLTSGPKVDPGWNMDLVNNAVDWVDKEAASLMGTNWPEVWSPERMTERKMDAGYYAGDKVPTIDMFDFYFWSDENKKSGWRRRIILDAWGTPDASVGTYKVTRRVGDPYNKNQGFLYNSKDRVYAEHLSEMVSFQFADLSAVSPFRYHSVRSLGKLLYAICHLQNRLRCKFNESIFEALMQYFRVASEDDIQQALKVEMINRGFISPSVKMIPASERWQVNAGLVELGLTENRNLIEESSAGYGPGPNFSKHRVEKTKFEVMAELQGMTAMLSAGIAQATAYQLFEYQEIFRRFMRPNSRDADVREFRASCLRQGVPERLMNADCWEIMPEQIMGSGNQTLQMQIAQQLLEMRPMFDPEPQREILRDITFAITQDAARTKVYVPDGPGQISNSIHDAQVAIGTILQGGQVAPVAGQNHQEVIEVWLRELGRLVQEIQKSGGVPRSVEQLRGSQNLAAHIASHIAILSQNEAEKQRVKQYGDSLGRLMNEVKAFAQRLAEQMQRAQQRNGHGGMDPETTGKIRAMQITAQAKAQNSRESHALKTAQRQVQFEIDQRQKKEEHQQQLNERAQEAAVKQEVEAMKGAAAVRQRMRLNAFPQDQQEQEQQ